MTICSISLLVLALGLGYIGLIEYCLFYWERLPEWRPAADHRPQLSISVIVPARNEAHYIEACIQSLLRQDYPTQLYEVLVINDHSEDDTLAVAQAAAAPPVKVLSLPVTHRGGKKAALQYGIQQAVGQVVLTTDADCVVPRRWLRHLAAYYEIHQPVFVAAPVVLIGGNTMLEKFQMLDLLGMMVLTGAGIASGRFHLSNGANLGYLRQVFYDIGGFQGIDQVASGDDMLLMHKIAACYPGRIGFVKDLEVVVRTPSVPTWRAFIQQRLRWSTKSKVYQEWRLQAVLVLIFVLCWSILLSPLLLLIFGLWGLLPLLLLLLTKSWGDYRLLSRAVRYFRRPGLIRYFWPSQFLHILYVALMGLLAIFFTEYKWKGRKTS